MTHLENKLSLQSTLEQGYYRVYLPLVEAVIDVTYPHQCSNTWRIDVDARPRGEACDFRVDFYSVLADISLLLKHILCIW